MDTVHLHVHPLVMPHFHMLWLYWFGTLPTVFSGTWLMAVYLTGGLAGAGHIPALRPDSAHGPTPTVGASAAVLAVVVATAVARFRAYINLMLIGRRDPVDRTRHRGARRRSHREHIHRRTHSPISAGAAAGVCL